MNQYEWKRQSRRLMESQEKFVKTVYTLFDCFEAQSKSMMSFNKALDAREAVFDAGKKHADAQMELIDQLLEGFKAAAAAHEQLHLTVQENNDRLERLITKVETYFGTTGLDYDN